MNEHKETTIDELVLYEHYPYNFYWRYLHDKDSLKKHTELQGLPTYDIYKLNYDDVRLYLLKKTEIRLKSERLYKNKKIGYNTEEISNKNLILFLVCYIPSFILFAYGYPEDDDVDRNKNIGLVIASFVLMVLPFIIRKIHKALYVRLNDRKIYDEKIEIYLDVLSKYIEWLDEKDRYNRSTAK